ncbi:MAG: carboxymuconolactone decarboxylase family protein [Solobacterium sp.]|jgi:AhpD family alkylhydroperoxidase|nr:carboxymuconolactone decarboxylase family protein [Solobacterium sp.]
MKTNSGRKLYGPGEAYVNLWHGFRAIPLLKKSQKEGLLSDQFRERIMLAVTAVNGCAMCSYAHTGMALETGMSEQEIKKMLAGEAEGIPEEELPAVLFGQHYADQRGKPTEASWKRLNEVYGAPEAAAVLSAVQMIMLGNTYGIPAGSLKSRIHGDKAGIDTRSSAGYEVGMLLLLIPYIPAAAVTALTASLFHLPMLKTVR